jgi:hypothetical protein
MLTSKMCFSSLSVSSVTGAFGFDGLLVSSDFSGEVAGGVSEVVEDASVVDASALGSSEVLVVDV